MPKPSHLIALALMLGLGASSLVHAQTAVPTLISADGTCSLETDKAYKAPGEAAVYYVSDDCKRRAFKNPDLFFTYFNSWNEVITDSRINGVGDHDLGFMPWGPQLEVKPGSLIKTVDNPNVYFVTEGPNGEELLPIDSEAAANEHGLSLSWVQDVDPRVINARRQSSDRLREGDAPPVGAVLQFGDAADLFQVEWNGSERQLTRIPDEETFRSRGLRFDRIAQRPQADETRIPLERMDAPSIRDVDDSRTGQQPTGPDAGNTSFVGGNTLTLTGVTLPSSDYMGSYTIDDADHGTEVTVTVSGDTRTIAANALPNHATGEFPNSGNPNAISAQSNSYSFPAVGAYTGTASWAREPGVAINGVKFEPETAERAECSTGETYKIEALQDMYDLGFDQNNAHVQPGGTYHYHGVSSLLVDNYDDGSSLVHVGFAADGHKMYYDTSGTAQPSWRLSTDSRSGTSCTYRGETRDLAGTTPDGTYVSDWVFDASTGNLDACNGAYVDGEYVYFITNEYPFISRCLQGSFSNSMGGGQSGPPSGSTSMGPGAYRPDMMGPPDRQGSRPTESTITTASCHNLEAGTAAYGYNQVLDADGVVKDPQGKPFQEGDSLRRVYTYVTNANERAYARIFSYMAPIRDALMCNFDSLTLTEWQRLTQILTVNGIKTTQDLSGTPKDQVYSTDGIFEHLSSGLDFHPMMKYLEEAELELKCLAFSGYDFTNPEGVNHCELHGLSEGSGIALP